MKVTVIKKKRGISYRVFLLLMTPLLIGFMIYLIPQANSEWQRETKEIVQKSPVMQGWTPVEFKD